jgi:hypothetical protein
MLTFARLIQHQLKEPPQPPPGRAFTTRLPAHNQRGAACPVPHRQESRVTEEKVNGV